MDIVCLANWFVPVHVAPTLVHMFVSFLCSCYHRPLATKQCHHTWPVRLLSCASQRKNCYLYWNSHPSPHLLVSLRKWCFCDCALGTILVLVCIVFVQKLNICSIIKVGKTGNKCQHVMSSCCGISSLDQETSASQCMLWDINSATVTGFRHGNFLTSSESADCPAQLYLVCLSPLYWDSARW